MKEIVIVSEPQEPVVLIVGENYRGPKGDKGDKGNPGENGKSAYEIAQANGFTGTETQWMDYLRGEKGDKGDQGIQGEPGPKGDVGPSSLGSKTKVYEFVGTNTCGIESDGSDVVFTKIAQSNGDGVFLELNKHHYIQIELFGKSLGGVISHTQYQGITSCEFSADVGNSYSNCYFSVQGNPTLTYGWGMNLVTYAPGGYKQVAVFSDGELTGTFRPTYDPANGELYFKIGALTFDVPPQPDDGTFTWYCKITVTTI